jgi:hypothetical protein
MNGMLRRMFLSEDWKRVFAWVVVYGYAYNVAAWGFTTWVMDLISVATGTKWPGPPVVAWEQLAVMTANLAVIGGVQLLKDRESNKQLSSTTSTVEASVETTTIKKA